MNIAVTGLGATCALGVGVPALAGGIRAGRSGLRALERFDPGGLPRCPVGEAELAPGVGSPTHRLAVTAAREAALDAHLEGIAPERIAVVVGTTTGGIALSEAWYLAGRDGSPPAPDPLRWHAASTVSRVVAEAVGARGPRYTISTACSSGANALLVGADLLRTGAVDAVVAGGAEGLCRVTYTGFSVLRLMSTQPCRPFDAGRDGLNLGEAAAFLVLRRAEDVEGGHARLVGAACTCDAHHMTSPAPDGASVVAAIEGALAQAGLAPADIAYVNAHATATKANDSAESRALRAVFGEAMPPVSASKSFLGHTLGAAGAIEAVVSVLAARDGVLPATLHTQTPGEDAPPDIVAGSPRDADVPYVLSTAFAFGGNDAALVFAR